MIPVVILTAGSGKRLGAVGEACRKALLPLGDGTLLAHHLREFSAIGANRFIIIADPSSEDIENEARRVLKPLGGSFDIIPQPERLGIGHAALLAEPRLGGGPFALVLGDTYYSTLDLASAAREISAAGSDAILSIRKVEDEAAILKECTVELDAGGLVRKIVEKPRKALSMLKPCGVYFFGPGFMETLRATPASALRGEIELTDAIQRLIDAGGRVKARETLKFDVNITYPADIITANIAWLRGKNRGSFAASGASVGTGAHLEDSVVSSGGLVGAGASLVRTVVFPGGQVPARTAVADALVLPGLGRVDVYKN